MDEQLRVDGRLKDSAAGLRAAALGFRVAADSDSADAEYAAATHLADLAEQAAVLIEDLRSLAVRAPARGGEVAIKLPYDDEALIELDER